MCPLSTSDRILLGYNLSVTVIAGEVGDEYSVPGMLTQELQPWSMSKRVYALA